MLHFTHITQLIAELLYKHDCVIVPQFGGFVARKESSHFTKGNALLMPPTKQLLFNKNLIHQDGLLVSALMETSSINYNDAVQQITDYKDYIQSLLQAKKRFELQNIGLLYIDEENSLRFEPKVNVNFLIESFGFEPVLASEIVIEPIKPIIEKHFEDRRIAIEELPIKRKKSYAKMAALAIGIPATFAFLLFAAYSKPMQPLLQSSLNPFYIPAKTYNPTSSKYAKMFVISDVIKKPLIEDANGYSTFKLSEESPVLVASAHTDLSNVNESHINSNISTSSKKYAGKYQVVMGCFGVITNAEKLVSELQKNNIPAKLNGLNAKGLHVVSCGGFNNQEDARKLLDSIKSSYPKAWVMSK